MSQGWKDRERGRTRRRYGVPIEVLDALPNHGRGAPRHVPEDASLCPGCGTLTVRLSREQLAHVWFYLMQQGALPMEDGDAQTPA